MKSKTWKLGEWAKGGIITVNINGKIITVIGKEWDFSKGSTRNSDQSQAKEFTRGTTDATDEDAYRKLYDFLSDLTTHYYADTILKWIQESVSFKRVLF